MDINLTDLVPVQRKYTAIPRPVYAEVKQYIEDLLNRGWIQRSKSAYSSPVVCVRKKDGSLRLCVDYRQLNSKNSSRQPPFAQGTGCPGKPWWESVVLLARPRKGLP